MKGVTNMTPEEMYLTERLDVQIAHFLKKSVQHRRRYKVLKITEIVAGFLIAVLFEKNSKKAQKITSCAIL